MNHQTITKQNKENSYNTFLYAFFFFSSVILNVWINMLRKLKFFNTVYVASLAFKGLYSTN